MQYKQARRIVMEIFLSKNFAGKLRPKLVPLLLRDDWPKLGPFKKRSAEQVLWRVASDAKRPGTERWVAAEKLLEIARSLQQASAKKMRSKSEEEMDRALGPFPIDGNV